MNQDHRELEKLRIQLLFKQNGMAQTASLVNACIYLYLFEKAVPGHALTYWFIWFILLMIVRLAIFTKFMGTYVKQGNDFDPVRWENIFSFGVLAAGLTWGFAASVLMPHGSLEHFAFMGFLLAGTTAGASVAYCSSVKATQAFLLSSIIPFIIRLLFEGTSFQHGMAGLLTCYIVVYGRLTKEINVSVITSIKLRFEKNGLLEELKAAHSQILNATKMAALGQMAAGIAHEINNPLGIIRGNNQLIQQMAKMDQLKSAVVLPLTDKVDSTVLRIAKIITGLRVFAREGDQDPFEMVSVKAVIEETLSFCQARFKNRDVRLEVGDIPESMKIECRRIQVCQVLLNLLNNAFDAVENSQERWVRIDVKETAGRISFIVGDSGPGIPESLRDKLMQPFFTTKEIGKGTGLGLSIARGIVESHHGTLILDTNSEKTTFVMTLPKLRDVPLEVSA